MSQDAEIRDMLNVIRGIRFGESLNEARNPDDAIAITDDPRFGQKVLSSQIEQFRSAVDGGAQFSNANEDDVASSPLIYLPGEGNLIFSGMIPSLGNLKFQFKLKSNTGYGAWIFVSEGMVLTERTLETINRIYQFYMNWVEEWEKESADLDRMARAINNKI